MGGEYADQEVMGDFRNSLAFKATFAGVTFHECKMGLSNFAGSVFKDCKFDDCDLGKANFNACKISGTRFVDCNLDQATFKSADIRGTVIEGGRAEYADFEEAAVQDVRLDTQLHGADLRFSMSKELDYGNSNFWGASFRFSCAQFNGVRLSPHNFERFLAILCRTVGNESRLPEVLKLVSKTTLEVDRRVSNTEA
jgi:uncharacterized protein YjbI with pentapeptide repeats